MNKLTDTLKIIQALGWTKALSKEHYKAFEFLVENKKDCTNEELSDADLAVVEFVNKILEEKTK
jgi:hypothetical protein